MLIFMRCFFIRRRFEKKDCASKLTALWKFEKLNRKENNMFFEETFRWYGPEDPVSLAYIRQAGATGVVNALHSLAPGIVWTEDAIRERCRIIEDAGLTWSVIESLPVHEDIKTGAPSAAQLIENYKTSIRNLGKVENGPRVITYNFMPVLDWIRTDLHHKLPDGSETLFYDQKQFAAFEVFILQRKGAENDYTPELLRKAEEYYKGLSKAEIDDLTSTLIDNFPGFKGVKLDDIRAMLGKYEGFTRERLEENLHNFLSAVVPVAEENGCYMVIHPDDPPRSILGLPRIFSNIKDVRRLLKDVDSPANGVCFCSGSFSASKDNDVVAMFKECADRVHFMHMRSTQHEGDGNFFEANHLEGRVDMYELMKALCDEQVRRKKAGRKDWRIPVRPDHGHRMMDDLEKPDSPNPGYTCLGRMRGLAELRGLELGVMRAFHPEQLEK